MADEDKTKLRKYSETVHGDKTQDTWKEPEYTERYEQAIDGFRNPDGTPNEAAMQEFERRKAMLSAPAGLNLETGKVEDQNKFLTDVLHIDPDLMRKKREAEMELNRRKQKESAWYNSLAVLGDMVTTATGGNVWKRQPDQRAKAAHDTNLALEREQQAEDIANGERIRNAENTYAQQVQKIADAVGKAFGTKKVATQKSGGNSHSVTKTGKDITSGYDERLNRFNYGGGDGTGGKGGSGSGRSNPKVIKVQLKDGRTVDINMQSGRYDASGRYLSALYNALVESGEDNIDNVLSASGIEPRDVGKGKYTYDGADLLSSGIVFDNPKIRAEFVKAIQSDDSFTPEEQQDIIDNMMLYPTKGEEKEKESWWKRMKNKFKKQQKGWGQVTKDNNEDYDF